MLKHSWSQEDREGLNDADHRFKDRIEFGADITPKGGTIGVRAPASTLVLPEPRGLEKPKESRSFKMDPDVYEGLRRLALKENRSVNNLAETLLWKAVEAELN